MKYMKSFVTVVFLGLFPALLLAAESKQSIQDVFKKTFDRPGMFRVSELPNATEYVRQAASGKYSVMLRNNVERGDGGQWSVQLSFSNTELYQGKDTAQWSIEMLNSLLEAKQIKTKTGKKLVAGLFAGAVVVELNNLSDKNIIAVKDQLKAVIYAYEFGGIAGYRMFREVGEKLSPDLYTW